MFLFIAAYEFHLTREQLHPNETYLLDANAWDLWCRGFGCHKQLYTKLTTLFKDMNYSEKGSEAYLRYKHSVIKLSSTALASGVV
jgi:hypothetical protein